MKDMGAPLSSAHLWSDPVGAQLRAKAQRRRAPRALVRKRPTKMRHPIGLRHPVVES